MTSLIAIGAGIAALTGIGAGIGSSNLNHLILRLRKGYGRVCSYLESTGMSSLPSSI